MIMTKDVEQLVEIVRRIGRDHIDFDLKRILQKIIEDDLTNKEIKNESMRLTSIAESLEKDMKTLGLKWRHNEDPHSKRNLQSYPQFNRHHCGSRIANVVHRMHYGS